MSDTSTSSPTAAAVLPAKDSPAAVRASGYGWFAARFAVIGVWLLLAVLFSALRPDTFMTVGALKTILGGSNQTTLVFLTAALLCTILVGEFVDMSIASNFGLAATLVTVLNVNHGWNVWLAALIALAVATAVGVVNGWLAVKVGVNTIVVTLGMGTLLLGIALWLSDLMPVSGLPASFQQIATRPFLGLPVAFF
jgi:ribose transport system permease protein